MIRTDIARVIYTAMYSGHDVPTWEDAPVWRRHRAYIAAGLVMARMRAVAQPEAGAA